MPLTRESQILVLICLVDLASTLILLSHGHALEGNPVMAFYLRFGVWAFVGIKLALIALPIFIAEWSMRYRPQFVRLMLRSTIALYMGAYLVIFLSVNVIANTRGIPVAPPPQSITTTVQR